ncbi:MAG TPA: hypothetical protein DCE47_09125, partial [Planctomycetaceae bacterium]|nr:hypothetical protein [Planctomycetaceae bacterium]
DNTYNINGVDLGGSGVGTTEAAGTVTIDDGQGDSTWNIQGNELSAASDHVFNGGAGDDDFTIFLTDGGEVSADSLEINGQAQDTDRDRVILDVTADTGSARGVTMTYADATKASGDLDVGGLTAAAAAEQFIDLNSVEQVNYRGDTGNNDDAVTVLGTAGGDDVLSVTPITADEANVFIDGTPFLKHDPPTESALTNNPGVAGGGVGPDISIDSIAQAGGLVVNGNSDQDRLVVNAPTESNATVGDTAATAGFGGNVYGSSTTVRADGQAFDDITVTDAAVGITLKGDGSATDTLVQVNFDSTTYGLTDPADAELTVNAGEDAGVRANPATGFVGVADDISVTLSRTFHIQVNAGEPPLPVDTPANASAEDLIGDRLNVDVLNADGNINIYSDLEETPNVSISSTDSIGTTEPVTYHSVETTILAPGDLSQQVNVIGDNNDFSGADQDDEILVVGGDIDSLLTVSQSDADGANEFNLLLNGSNPIQVYNTQFLNISAREGDDDITIEPYANDLTGNWNIDPVVDGGAGDDDLIYGSGERDAVNQPSMQFVDDAPDGAVSGVSEDITIAPSGTAAGQVRSLNASDGTNVSTIDFSNTEDITVFLNDGSAGDDDALTILGTPDADTFVVNLANNGDDSGPLVDISGTLQVETFSASTADARPSAGDLSPSQAPLEDLTILTGAGDDTIQVVGRTDGATTLTIDAGDPDASDTLALDITTGNDSYTISRGDHAREGSVVVSLDGAVATQVNFDGIENISVDQLGLHASSGDGGTDLVTLNGTGGDDAISVSSITPDDLSATVGNGPTITLDELGDGTTVTVSAAGGDDSLSLSTTNADDTIDYTANSATSASLDVSDGTETISFNIGGSESLSIDTSGETSTDVLNVTNADAAVTSTGGGSGVVDPVDAAGAGLLSLGFSNVESAVVTGTTGVVQGTSGDDAISLSATGQLTVTDLFGNGDSTFDVSGYQALVINALGGNDDVSITASSSFASGLSVLGGDSDNDGDTVNISAAGNNVSVALSSNTVSGVTAGDITLDSVEALALDATGNLSVDGTAGHDTLQFQASSAANGSVTLVGGNTGVSYTNLGGNLTVDGGTAGVDVLVVQGSEGDDTVTSASTTEVTLNGTVTIGAAIDRLDIQTGGGNDSITISDAIVLPKAIDAGDGDDTIDLSGAGAADPTIIGGLGDDTITGSAGVDIILAGAGNDSIAAGAGADVVYAGEGNDDITGGTDDDVIHGGDGSDTIHWATGDGADTVEGDDGSDVLDYSDAAATISVDLSDIRAAVGSVDAAGIDRIDVTGNIINIVGSNNDDAIAIVDDGVGTAVTGLSVPLDITGATQIGIDSGTGSDALTVTGNSVTVDTAGATITGATPSTVNYSNLEAVSVLASAGTALTVSGSGAYTVSPGAAADEGTILTDNVTVSFDGFGSGTTLNVDADLTLNGSDSDDAISVAAGGTVSVAGRADVATSSAGDDLVLVSGNGDDAVTIAAGHAWATIDVQGGNPSASDTATLTGDATAVTVTLSHSASVSGGGLGTVSLSGIETATVNNGAGDLTVDGSGGADDFTVRPTGADTATTTVAGIHPVLNSNNSGALTINDGTAADGDSLAVTYDDGDQVVSIDDNSVDSAALKDVGYTAANIATLAVSTKGGADSVTVTDGTTTPVTVDGGGSQNDTLTMQGSGATANTYVVQPGTSVVMNSTTADFTGVERLVLDSNSQSGSVSVTADGAGNQLSYVGDAAATGSATISIDGALAASLSNFASASSVTLDPGDGDDTVSVAPNAASDLATVTVLASSGSDALTVEGDSGADALVYTPGAADADGDVVIDGVTTTFGSVESITLSGQGGSDAITVNATAGDDTITYVPGLNDDAQVQVNSNTSVAIDSIEARTIDSGAGTDSLAVSATDFSDSIAIAGAAGSNTIVVNGAAVTFDHDATAADTLALGSGHGNDSLSITPTAGLVIVADAGDGNDDVAVNGTAGADSITVALNSQTINGLGGQLTLAAAESLSLSGAGGTDDVTVTESGLSSELGVVSLSAAAGSSLTVVGTSGDETFSVSPTAAGAGSYSEAGAGPDVDYSGFDNASTFDGNGGFDVIVVNGNDAADTVTSTANSVTIKGGAVTLADLDRLELNTGGGDDNVDLDLQDASLQKVVNAGAGNDIVDASGAIDATINGGDGDDNLVGSPVADLINGQGGDDTIGGGDGDDILFGGSGNDVLSGDDGADQLSGQVGNDDLSGNAGVDSLFGGDGSDEINWISGDGNDVVQGGDGADVLDVDYTAGADTIAINSVPASGTDFLRVQVGDGTDQVDVAGVEDLDVDLAGGADDITINDLSSTEMSLIQVDLGAADGAADAAHLTGADGQNYSLSASLDAVTGEVHVDGLASDVQLDSAEAGDTLELTGGDRADSLTASSDLSGVITVELRGAGGDDVLTGGDDLEGGAGDDVLQAAYVSANVSGDDGEDTIVVGSGNITIDGGAGSDVVVIDGTSSADVIDVAQTADDTLTHSTDGVFGVGATSETDTISNVEAVRIEAGAGKDVIRVTQADGLTPSQSVRVEVDGGAPDASDRLAVVDDGNGNTVIHRIDVDGSSGSVNVGSFSSVDYDGVEQLSITPLDDITGTTGTTDNLGRLVVFKNDGFESNDSLPNATFLGSGANLNVDPTIDPAGFSAFGIPGDEDWYQFTPSETGTLDIQVSFEEVGTLGNTNDGLPGDGNLDIAVFDSNGDPVATSTSTDDNERITVPVVEDEVYYLQVASATGADAINVYSLTAINDPAPVPFVVDLQAGSDTGRSDTDDITFSTTPVLDIYLDDDRLEEYLNLDLVPDADFDIDVYNNGVLLGEADFIGGAGVAGNSRWEFTLSGGDLQEGHNNFLTAAVRIRDAASPQVEGRGAFSTPLQLTLDTIAPSVAITGLDDDGSDSGVNSYQPTLSDDITSDVAARFTGTTSEANAIVRLFADGTANTTIDTTGEFAVTASGPLDGDEAFADSQWTTSYVRGLNDATSASGFAYDGLREILATAEDIAGNVGALDSTTIFVDTQGPQVTGVQFNSTASTYNVFNPQPAVDGPTPSVSSIVVSVEDLAVRAGGFTHSALEQGVADDPGQYTLVGDNVGEIPIASVTVSQSSANGAVAASTITLGLDTFLADDRYTLTVSDVLADPAGNALDGESNATGPQATPSFTTGDGQPGGDFAARFTVDSRPELGVVGQSGVAIDANDNLEHDPNSGDAVHRDLNFAVGLQTDAVFAGQFTNGGAADGFDRLGTYGKAGGLYRWQLDLDNDGAIGAGDLDQFSSVQVNGLPVAGDFDGVAGDEIGLFDGTTWYLDTTGDLILETTLASDFSGLPIVGDFDGDGNDDLAVFSASLDLFSFDLDLDGVTDATISFGFPGVNERPIAGDYNLDGIDDIGLTTPNQSGNQPGESLEFYLLQSDGSGAAGNVDSLDHAFSPFPLGNDRFGQFGNNLSVPVFGNFDPPVAPPVASSASSEFDPSSGTLTVTASAGSSVVIQSSGSLVQVLVDGQLDSGLGTVLTSNVTSMVVTGSDSSDTIDLAGVTSATYDRLDDVLVQAGAGDDVITGTMLDDRIWAGAGDDVVDAGAGDDWINGQRGNDRVAGGAGRDRFLGGGGNDEFDGGDADDFAQGNSGDDILRGGDGNDRLNGSGGHDQLMGQAGDDRLLAGAGRDTLAGDAGDDFLNGQGGADILEGGDGRDRIKGGIGNDRLFGGADDDRLMGEAGNDVLEGGAGNDRLRGQLGDDLLSGNLGDDVLNGGDGFDRLSETFDTDFLLTDTTLLGVGADSLIGIDGATLIGGSGNNLIDARSFSGEAILVGRAGDDVLYGGSGRDQLFGGAGNDLAVGGAGYDIIKGQGGTDSLAGGEGPDQIVGESSEIDEEFAVLDDWADLMG